MISEIITPNDERWSNCLDGTPHDFYHTPEYIYFSSRYEGGLPLAFWAEENGSRLLLPVLRRELPENLLMPEDWFDASSPYGYPSLLISPGTSEENLNRLLQAFLDSARAMGLVSVFVRLHPLLEIPYAPLEQFGQLVKHGQTVFIDLTRPLDELRCETRENHRRGIKKLLKNGFKAVIDDWQHLIEFAEIYRLTMQRVEADSFYLFSDDYFCDMREFLSEYLHICSILSPDGRLSSACLFTSCGDIIQYHLGGTSPDYIRDAPSKLMFDTIRSWGKDAGYKYFHLGGGLGAGEDSLFHFKAGFAKHRRDFFTFRMIIDKGRYLECVRSWQGSHLSDQTNAHAHDFFPLYRKL